MRALIVDDSRAMRAVIRDVLRRARYQVFEAGSVAEALDGALEFRPVDLAIVDWSLPHKGGVEFVREIRRRSEGATMWILMVTLDLKSEVVLEAVGAGVDDWILKPFTRAALLEKIARLQTHRGLRP